MTRISQYAAGELVQCLERLEVFRLHFVAELILYQNHDVHHFQGINAQVFFQAGAAFNFILINLQILHQEVLYLFVDFFNAHVTSDYKFSIRG